MTWSSGDLHNYLLPLPLIALNLGMLLQLARFILETEIRPDGSSVKKDHPSSINTGRTMKRTIGVPCGSYRFYSVLIVY